ncbi:MAG: B12-binding domain-containing radical SAM protein [Desulfobacterales bacterium]
MTDILLVQPPIRDFYLTAKRTLPYGLASIAGALEAEGFSVEIIDTLATARSRPIDPPPALVPATELFGPPDRSPFGLFSAYRHYGYSFDHLPRLLKGFRPLLVGISSLFTPYEAEALEAARRIRSVLPECPIVLGGHHPTAHPERIMAHSFVDYVVRGDGEQALPMLARALRDGSGIETVPGLVFRNPTGSLTIRPPTHVAAEDLPTPAFQRIHGRYYRRNGRRQTVVVASRGCPMDCSYCCMGKRSSIPYRRRTVESVMKDIRAAASAGDVGFIDFEDENLSLDRRWFLELLKAIENEFKGQDVELRAMNGLMPSSLDDETVLAMQKAGFRALNLSLGTTCQEQISRFGRPDLTAALDRCLRLAARYRLNSVAYVIAGAPYQSPESSVDDLLFLLQRSVLAAVSIFYPAPGSADYELCRRIGLLPTTVEAMRSSALPLSHHTSRLDAVTLLRLSRIVNFMKHLLDSGDTIPPAAPLPDADGILPENRIEVGKVLLSCLFHDGSIRGVDGHGSLITHRVSEGLVRRFLLGLESIEVCGVKDTTPLDERGQLWAPMPAPSPCPGNPGSEM